MPNPTSLIAVDVGNHRVKLGRFQPGPVDPLPEPLDALQIADEAIDWARLEAWLGPLQGDIAAWWIASVNRPTTTRLIEWLRDHRPGDRTTLVVASDVPIEVAVDRPDMVGIDRLLDAAVANRLRDTGRPAVVIDVGSAITVDLLSSDGVFLGGAILPGIAMSARAMHAFTDLLPEIGMSELAVPPPPVGTATEPAMRSGLFWGAVGAIRQLIERMGAETTGEPEIFLTGGAGPTVAELLDQTARHVPHLTLIGVVLAAQASSNY